MLYLTLPCLAMKHLSARINDSVYWVCNFNIHCSTCKAWKHCTISLQFLLALFFDKWTKHIHSQYVKGGRKPLKLLQITHLLTALLVTLFPHIIQKPEFPNWLSVTPLPEWPTLMWHYSRIFLEMMASFGSIIGWRRFSLYVDLFSLPPILIIPSSTKKGSNL